MQINVHSSAEEMVAARHYLTAPQAMSTAHYDRLGNDAPNRRKMGLRRDAFEYSGVIEIILPSCYFTRFN
jgi:hypothetical protein